MRAIRTFAMLATAFGCLSLATACEKQEATPPATPQPAAKPATGSAPPASSPPAAAMSPPAPASISAAPPSASGSKLELDGLTFSVPEGWNVADPGTAMFAPKAAFSLAKAEGDGEDVSVRITHYPEQKGKDDMNLDRWLGQVTRPDGTPYTKENANIKVTESGSVRLTVVDLPGSVSTNMMGGGGAATPNQRMIAAIVDHPRGPHFVRVLGGAASVEKWAASVDAFLKSAVAK
jgi:hypothetical protein